MSTAIQYPLVNGVRHSMNSIELKINGQVYYAKSVNYTRTRSRAMVGANHPDPLGKTRGKNEYKADIELYLAEFNLVQAQLQVVAGGASGYGDVLFPILVTYTENGFDTIQDTILGCSLDSTDASNSEGPDALARKVELNPVKILYNGIDDLTVPLVGVQQ